MWLATPGVSAASSTSIRHNRAARCLIGGAKRIRPKSYAEEPSEQALIESPLPRPPEMLSHMRGVRLTFSSIQENNSDPQVGMWSGRTSASTAEDNSKISDV